MMAEYIDLTKDDGIDLHIISSEESNNELEITNADDVKIESSSDSYFQRKVSVDELKCNAEGEREESAINDQVVNTKFHKKEIAQLEESSDIDNSFLSDVSSTGASNTESDQELTNIQYFDGDPNIPMYRTEAPSYGVDDAVKLLFNADQDVICSKQPVGCKKSATFIIDVSNFGHCDDVRADDLGVWCNKGVRTNYFRVSFRASGNVKHLENLGTRRPVNKSQSIYSLKRTYWRHSEDDKFCRRLLELKDIDNKPYKVCILQYHHPSEATGIGSRPHKNSVSKSCFVRTKKSVHNLIKENKDKGPSQSYDTLFETCGGIMNATSLGSLPRDRKQISNFRSSSKSESSIRDTLFAVIEQCKKEESKAGPFIRTVQGAPDSMCLLATNRQLHDMVRFCTNRDEFSIVGVDPTFNLGDFSVTVTTYRHLQLYDRTTKKHPVLLGPLLIHQRKSKQSYYFMASSLVGLCPQLSSLLCFGTDGEKALGDAFELQFQNATHLLCFLHVKERIMIKLRDMGIAAEAKQFINEIFGYQEGTHRFTGLVDCDTTDEFDRKLAALEDIWNEREMRIRGTSSTNSSFFMWFLDYQAENMKTKMLKPLRVKSGLGNPPKDYTNNANESTNARIKEKVNYQRSELHVFCSKMKELVDKQTRDIERAFTMDTGSYMVAEKYCSEKQNPKQWTKQSMKYKEHIVNKIHKIPLLPSPPTNAAMPAVVTPDSAHQLSIGLEETNLSEELFSDMWIKAAKLAKDTSAITNAPGLATSKMVASISNPKTPHLVTYFKSGKMTCNCVSCDTKRLCAHMLAVAEVQGSLKELIDWYERTNQDVSLWRLVRSSGVPKHPGDKGNSKKCKRSRKIVPAPESHSSILPDLDADDKSPKNKRAQKLPSTPAVSACSSRSAHAVSPSNLPVCYSPHMSWSYPPYWYNSTPQYAGPSPPVRPPQCSPFHFPPEAVQTVYKPTSTEPFTLKFITKRITKCQGCKQKIREDDDDLPLPPNDLIIARMEQRPFVTGDGSVKIPSKTSNSHYHLRWKCLQLADAAFNPANIVTPTDVSAKLTPVHKEFLLNHFHYYL